MATALRHQLAALHSPRVLGLFRPVAPLVAALDAGLGEGDRDLQRQLVDLRAAQDYRYGAPAGPRLINDRLSTRAHGVRFLQHRRPVDHWPTPAYPKPNPFSPAMKVRACAHSSTAATNMREPGGAICW